MGDIVEFDTSKKRVPVEYIVTREQKRYLAKKRMKEEKRKNVCKHSYTTIKKNNFVAYNRVPSYFAEHWREYV